MIETYQTRYHQLSDLLSNVILYPLDKKAIHCRGDFFEMKSDDFFCGFFTPEELKIAFSETGCLQHWHEQGYTDIRLKMSRDEKFRFRLNIVTDFDGKEDSLMDLVVWLEYVYIESLDISYPSFCVDHLVLQQPGKLCDDVQMPGQTWASSHLLRRMFHIITHWAALTGASVVTEIPEYFHTAYIFSQYFRYIDSEMETIFRDFVKELLPEHPSKQAVSELSHQFEQGLIYKNGQKYLWPTEMQIYPLSSSILV